MDATTGYSARIAPGVESWSTSLFIGNESRPGQGACIAVTNPATEEVLAEVASASLEQVDEAVQHAGAAFRSEAWADAAFRRACIHRLADLIEENADHLMTALVEEIGTPINHRAMHIDTTLAFLRFFADAAVRDRTYKLPPLPGAVGTENTIALRPSGVVAAIIAYNYPLVLFATKLGAALAAGCTLVLLPSPQAPLTILLLKDLIVKAGFPRGAVNILFGGPEIGRAVCEHSGVDKVSFTGSVGVGRQIMQQAATGIRGVILELGGKSAAIMMPGVDFKPYTLKLHQRYLQNAGQGCGSPTRLLVERSRLDEFLQESRRAYQQIKVGNPRDPETLLGPVISKAHQQRIQRFVSEALEQGGEIAAGGGLSDEPRGWYVNPTLVTGIDNKAAIAREEIFGPVGVVLPYDSIDDAIDIANDSDLGLKAYLFGKAEECRALAPRLRVGTVVINGGTGLRADAPMGGFKHSGLGREWGEEGVREFLESQHIDCVGLDV